MSTINYHCLKSRKRLAKIVSFFNRWILSSSWGCCGCCLMPWNVTDGHITHYEFDQHGVPCRGCFPLCNDCWKNLSIEERIPFYKEMFDNWKIASPIWENMKEQVLMGK